MTHKQKTFCDEYILTGGNSAAAARAAGYAVDSAKVTGSKLLKRPDVRSAIDTKLESLISEKTADARELLEFLSAVMRGQIQEEVVVPSGKKVKVKVNCASRLKAAETLCKIYGLFKRVDDEPKNDFTEMYVEALNAVWRNDSSAD